LSEAVNENPIMSTNEIDKIAANFFGIIKGLFWVYFYILEVYLFCLMEI